MNIRDAFLRVRSRLQVAKALQAVGEDVRPRLDDALEDLDGLVGRDDLQGRALILRSETRCLRAQIEAAAGGNPQPWQQLALADAERAVKVLPTVDPHVVRARVLAEMASLADGSDRRRLVAAALRDLKCVLRSGPESSYELQLIVGGHWNEAYHACVVVLERLEETVPQSAGTVALLGDALHQRAVGLRQRPTDAQDQFSRSVRAYDRALRIAPGSARLHWRRARVLLDAARAKAAVHEDGRAEIDEAVRSCDVALSFDPDMVLAYETRATLKLIRARLGDVGGVDAALADYDAAIARAPSAFLHADRARALAERCSFEESIRDFETAERLDPKIGEAHVKACARLAPAARDPAEAEHHCTLAISDLDSNLRRTPRSAHSFQRRAVARLLRALATEDHRHASEDVAAALQEIEQCGRLEGRGREYHVLAVLARIIRLSVVRRDAGDSDRAAKQLVAAWKSACRRKMDEGLNGVVGRALTDAGRFRDAEKAFVRGGSCPHAQSGSIMDRIRRALGCAAKLKHWTLIGWPDTP